MAEVEVSVGGRRYAMRCRDGDEARLARLASMIDNKAEMARRATPGLTEVRQLLFAALFLADDLDELRRQQADRQGGLFAAMDGGESLAKQAETIESIAKRIEAVADRLAGSAPTP